MATVVTVAQLQGVAAAQKAYIDKKADDTLISANEAVNTAKSDLEDKINEIPGPAADEEINAIKDLFAVEAAGNA